MSYENRRIIFKTPDSNPSVLRELLQTIFISEFVDPLSEEIWIVSPWISDIAVIDNQAGSFSTFNPEWNKTELRLSEVLCAMMSVGKQIFIVTTSDEHNLTFKNKIAGKVLETGCADRLTYLVRKSLHTKGILTSHGFLSGSMNLTYSGMVLNDETISYDISKEVIASAKNHCAAEYLVDETLN